MFLPLIIAILLGLANPNTTSVNSDGTVYVNSSEPEPGDPGDDDGGTPPDDGTGGDNGHIPPPPIKPKP
jgi:hypothetical protein